MLRNLHIQLTSHGTKRLFAGIDLAKDVRKEFLTGTAITIIVVLLILLVKRFWSTGVQYRGLIPGRDKDVTGFGVGQGRLSRQAGFTRSNETALEWYYNIELTPWLHVSPDIQYLFNPGGDASVRDAVVVGVRVQMSF